MSCATSSETFTDSVRVAGTAPPLPERFKQEVALFDFFINGLAVIDSFFYGLYWIGSMVDTNKFPILSGELLRDIQVVKTVEKYMARFPSSSLITAFGRLGHGSSSKDWKNTREYKEWKTVRNILAHRAAYGRALNLGSELGDVWRVGNIQLNDQLTSSRRQWLASTLTDLMGGAEGFVRSTL